MLVEPPVTASVASVNASAAMQSRRKRYHGRIFKAITCVSVEASLIVYRLFPKGHVVNKLIHRASARRRLWMMSVFIGMIAVDAVLAPVLSDNNPPHAPEPPAAMVVP